MVMPRLSIEDHLFTFGIRRFNSDKYWEWGGSELGIKKGMKLEELREPLVNGIASRQDYFDFYDFISDKKVSAVVHSMKADAIAKTGEAIDARLPCNGTVIDLGCSIGYLSTYFALGSVDRLIVGIDFSPASIKRAREEASKRKIKNINFYVSDYSAALPVREANYVISCQSLFSASFRQAALTHSRSALIDNGKLICVEPIPSEKDLSAFIKDASNAGLFLELFAPVFHSDLGERQMYSLLEFSTHETTTNRSLDAEENYAQAFRRALTAD
jgi:SAM-dependent methyltransferase